MNRGIGIIYAVLFIVALSIFIQIIEAIAPVAGIALVIIVGAIVVYEIVAITQGITEYRKLMIALKKKQKTLIHSRKEKEHQVTESNNEFMQPIEVLAFNYNHQQTPATFYVEQTEDETTHTNGDEQNKDKEETPLTSKDMSEDEYDELDDIIFNNSEEPDVGKPIDMDFASEEIEKMYNDSEVSDEDWDEYIMNNPNVYQFPDSDDDEFWDMLAEEYLAEEEERLAYERACIDSDRWEEEYLKDLLEEEYKKEQAFDEEVNEEHSKKNNEFTETSSELTTEEKNKSHSTNKEETAAKETKKQFKKRTLIDRVKGTFGKVSFNKIKQSITDRASMIKNDAKEHLPQMQQAVKDVISFVIKRIKLLIFISGVIALSVYLYADTWVEWLSYSIWAFALLAVTFTIRMILYVVFKQKTKSFTRTAYYRLMKRTNTVKN